MPEDIQQLITQIEQGERIKFLFFWGHSGAASSKSCLSQWFIAPFEFEGITFRTAEHWMMAEKARLFEDDEMYQRIVECETPGEAKKLGRKVRNFDPAIWEAHRLDIVIRGNELKFGQNEEMKDFLLSTGNRVLVEASPYDRIWGIGMTQNNEAVEHPRNWKGLNLLGFALMKVREKLSTRP